MGETDRHSIADRAFGALNHLHEALASDGSGAISGDPCVCCNSSSEAGVVSTVDSCGPDGIAGISFSRNV